MQNLVHIVEDAASSKAAVFDPAWEAHTIFEFLDKKNLHLDKILLTHSHYDHLNAMADLLAAEPVPVYMSQEEYEFYGEKIPTINLIKNKDVITVGQTGILSLFTPGHTPGGMSYLIDKDLICGDTLFVYGCGTCSLDGGDAQTMYESLTFLKSYIAGDVVIYPAHAYSVLNASNWQEQLQANPFLMLDNEKDFVRFRLDIHDNVRKYPMGPVSGEQLRSWMKL